MTQRLTILVGTMTGTAEMVAEEVKDALEAKDAEVAVEPMDDLDPGVFEAGGLYLICTSTYGQGDVPDNAQALFEALEGEAPDLSDISYGVIALGDMTYAQTFCQGGKRFDALLNRLGATRVGEPLLHDASSGSLPEDEAGAWAETWLENEVLSGKAIT